MNREVQEGPNQGIQRTPQTARLTDETLRGHDRMDRPEHKRIPWYLWPLAPFAFCASLVIIIPLGILALLSIPYFALFPDHHLHQYDLDATPDQKKMLLQWRETYRRLSLWGRLKRAWRNCQR